MSDIIWSRRSFLKAALAGTLVLAAKPAFSMDPTEAALIEEEAISRGLIKPGTGKEIAAEESLEIAKEDADGPSDDKPAFLVKTGRLRLYSPFNQERLDVEYRYSSGDYDEQALKAINHLLRCHHTDEEIKIDVRTIEYLNAVDKRLGRSEHLIHVISGYRSKEYNAMLRKRMRRVAKHSLHMTGQAVDIRIHDTPTSKIKKAALEMRYGGVGYYPRRGFVHLDSGRFRYW